MQRSGFWTAAKRACKVPVLLASLDGIPEVRAERRIVRSFLPDRPTAETVDRIIDSARKAPSAGFSQGIDFLCLDTKLRSM